jgi:hypothetical protein
MRFAEQKGEDNKGNNERERERERERNYAKKSTPQASTWSNRIGTLLRFPHVSVA